MTHLVSFIVPGAPPLARRVRAQRRGKGIHIHQTDETIADERRVAEAARRAGVLLPVDVPLLVDVVAVYARPGARPKIVPPEVWRTGLRVYRPVVPDRDNTDKAVLDGMQQAGRWEQRGTLGNDGQVCGGAIKKFWAAKGEEAHTVVVVRLLPWLEEAEALTGQALAGHAVATGAGDGAERRRRRGTPMPPNGTPPGGP
jgi:Holliday junction resolvase RusA-like endonuclease